MPNYPPTIPSTPTPYLGIRLRSTEESEYGDSTQQRSADIAIKHILEAIELSKYILTFEDDWDDDGSPAYKFATWGRAAAFLHRSALQMLKDYHVILDAPKILPGPAGSIDLHWKTSRRELLINIPEILDEPANFYGDDSTSNEHPPNQTVKGILNTSKDNQWLLMWLMQ
jgi:hypothetical protein